MTEWALFAFVNGKWRFEGFQEHEEIVTEFEEQVEEENGEGTAFVVQLPEVKK